ncbi:MAG: aerobic carbon-monoxide dehydrogenase medium subunit [Solirubrobacteraceae bacterium]|nr:aerobic carbon-monoxide dehydrogenase medium subunit [Solirubrobacteraceae bacterium]
MKPTRFDYHDPETLDETLTLIGDLGEDATLLAGGQSLVPMMNLRLVQPAAIVDLNRVSGLAYVRADAGHLALGAMTRARALERSPDVAAHAPLLAEAMPHVAYAAIRRRGTVGGSVAHADPAAEMPCALVAADATVVLAGATRRRELAATDFFSAPFMTAREPDELLVEIRVPAAPPGTATAFTEFARKSGDFALALAAVALTVEDGRCTRARVVLGGVAAAPVRATAAEELLEAEGLAGPALREAALLAAGAVEPTGDSHGSGEYRKRLAAVQVRRALETAAERAAATANGKV